MSDGGTRTTTGRVDGFAPIEWYAAIGDGRTTGLVALDGRLDWLAAPSVEAPPAFGALLDPDQGGTVALSPVAEARVERRYVPGTAVLETTYHTDHGSARVTDALNFGRNGLLPWIELVRRVEGLGGEVDMAWSVAPGNRFATATPWRSEGDTPLMWVGGQSVAVVADGVGDPVGDDHALCGRFQTLAGSRHLLSLVMTDDEPVFVPSPDEVGARLALTVDAWRRWHSNIRYEGRWEEAVRRSATALRLLVYEHTGAIVAAPTTSLPEAIGGARNFDYRYAWVRDCSFVLEAMIRLGLDEQVHRSLSWLVDSVRRSAPDIHVFYRLDGTVPRNEEQVPLRGYRDSRPVRSGNGASGQTQLGTFGDLIDTLWRYCQHGNLLDEETGRMVATCADRTCDIWTNEDAGLWELPEARHYTSSKIGCWLALDRAVRLAEAGQVPGGHAPRWERQRQELAAWVRAHCWSEERRAYTFHAGTEKLDCAVLLAARTGFDRGERLASTVDAIWEELGRGPLLYRYSGMEREEGAFLACSFWMVEALARIGRADEAADLMDELVELGNDVGLLSEEIDPQSRHLLGNFPLGLSHMALVNAAGTLRELGG